MVTLHPTFRRPRECSNVKQILYGAPSAPHFRDKTSCVMNEWLNWEECEAGIVLPEFAGRRAGSFIFSPTVRAEMFVTAPGLSGGRKVEQTEVYQTRKGEQTTKPAVGGADGVKQIDSYRYYDTDAAANTATEWYTFLMLISARQMSERAPARKLENEQKASQPANARSASPDAT